MEDFLVLVEGERRGPHGSCSDSRGVVCPMSRSAAVLPPRSHACIVHALCSPGTSRAKQSMRHLKKILQGVILCTGCYIILLETVNPWNLIQLSKCQWLYLEVKWLGFGHWRIGDVFMSLTIISWRLDNWVWIEELILMKRSTWVDVETGGRLGCNGEIFWSECTECDCSYCNPNYVCVCSDKV